MANHISTFPCSLGFSRATLVLFLAMRVSTPVSNSSGGLCPEHWTFSKYSGTCIQFSERSHIWFEANAVCRTYGGKLVTILRYEMNQFLYDQLQSQDLETKFWIGLTFQNDSFHWLESNDLLTYFNWKAGRPVGLGCVQIEKEEVNAVWSDTDCAEEKPFICEKNQDKRCPFGWTNSTGSWTCVKIFLDQLPWQTARVVCKSKQADLAILDEKMDMFLADFLKEFEYEYWIGLNDRQVEGEFKWLDNAEKAENIKWVSGNSGNAEEADCAQVRDPRLGLSLESCYNDKKFICEQRQDSKPVVTCSEHCRTNGLSIACDTTRKCTFGCEPGYQGALCEEACDNFTFGVNCAEQCSPNCAGPDKTCDHVNGTCTSGCEAGYEGALCDTTKRACDNFTFGVNCAEQCSPNCAGPDKTCDHVNGACTSGCEAGYEGALCDIECTEGTYGLNCLFNCSKNCEASCDVQDGNCSLGCKPGFTGASCSTEEKGHHNVTSENLEHASSETRYSPTAFIASIAFALVVLCFCLLPQIKRKEPKLETDDTVKQKTENIPAPGKLDDVEKELSEDEVSDDLYLYEDFSDEQNFWEEDYFEQDDVDGETYV